MGDDIKIKKSKLKGTIAVGSGAYASSGGSGSQKRSSGKIQDNKPAAPQKPHWSSRGQFWIALVALLVTLVFGWLQYAKPSNLANASITTNGTSSGSH